MARRPSAFKLLALSALITLTPPAWSQDRSPLDGTRLIGTAEFSWFGLRLYTARLWSAGAVQDWQQPFALELIYHRALSRTTLVQASLDEIQRLSDRPLAPDTKERWTKAMREAFVDVHPGTRITGLYLPGRGCRFYVDGQLSREIADPAFARAFFAIWLDPRTRDPQLRQRLLGLAGKP
ncbi:chalcone isomerase family protein [Pseudomonas asplenii]|uniref:chalcone isomerase family protein n=1 Tax=Pseudomonas asplenii TaxID=53407 RepID=UPI000366ABC4|nr:chalcone isomerase family protein [Pseudomonas fuscovaginae]